MDMTPFSHEPAAAVAPWGSRLKRWFLQKPTKAQVGFISGVLLTAICLKAPEWLEKASEPPQTAGDVAAAAAGSKAAAAAIPALRGIPNVYVSYYDIQATDAAGIKAELKASGIRWGDQRFRALTRWDYRWRWDANPDGGCGTANARVTFRGWITLPRLANPNALSPEVARAWQSYMSSLIRHEANHLRLAYGGRLLVGHAVRASGCATANAAGELAMARISYESAKYDERTYYGWREGAQFRPPSEH